MNTERVITYIDGFNLYFGLKDKGWKRFYWLNLQLLSQNLLKPRQTLINTKYFTTRVSSPPSKVKRQNTYIEALDTLNDFRIFYGHFLPNLRTCPRCKLIQSVPNEKMTDVNIAVEMLTDAFEDKFDTALLVSADSDLSGMIRSIQRLYPTKRIVAAFPPERYSSSLHQICNSSFIIGRAKLAQSQFTDNITKADGYILTRPQRRH